MDLTVGFAFSSASKPSLPVAQDFETPTAKTGHLAVISTGLGEPEAQNDASGRRPPRAGSQASLSHGRRPKDFYKKCTLFCLMLVESQFITDSG